MLYGGAETVLTPPMNELIDTKIGKKLAVDLDGRGFGLVGQSMHFCPGSAIADDVQDLMSDLVGFEPILGFIAPRAAGLDEEANRVL